MGDLFINYNLDSFVETAITDNDNIDGFGSVSPDGTQIVFHRWANGVGTLDLMNVDGSNVTQLDVGSGWAAAPSWSPDGTQIIYLGERGGDWEVCLLTLSTGEVTCVTDDAAKQEFPELPAGGGVTRAGSGAGPG